MRNNWLNKIVKSVFTKLLAIILITGFCINLVVAGFFWAHRVKSYSTFQQTVSHYLNYLLDDLGTPPSLGRAKEIAKQSSLDIHFVGSGLNWSTSGNLPALNKARFFRWHENPDIRFGRYRGRSLVEVSHEKGRFVFEFRKGFVDEEVPVLLIIVPFVLLGVILTGAYFAIRWVLRPVKWLDEGVQQVSRGNLQHRVPLKRSDELRDLAEAFNDMTHRIRSMLKSKEQLLQDVSHELRSPLTRMKVILEFLPEGKARANLQSDISEMERMVTEILEAARAHHVHGNLKRERVNLAGLIREILPPFGNQTPGVQVKELPEDLEPEIDAEQIKTVVKNLLNNALKYSNPNGKPVQIWLKKQPPYIIVQVRDYGIGIPEEELPFVFEPFYRVDKSRSKRTGGFGLGLSLCKTIMEAHGGKIDIDSSPDNGTRVSLYFPESSD